MVPLFLAARAHLLSRLGRHDEALRTTAELLETAGRLDSPPMLAVAQHDAGLVALAAGRPREAADLLAAALAGDAAVSRPAARLAAAEALAACGDPDAAAAELRRAVLEPVGPADQSWALVPRVARLQGLIAGARGDATEARRHRAPPSGRGVRGGDGRPRPAPAGRARGAATGNWPESSRSWPHSTTAPEPEESRCPSSR